MHSEVVVENGGKVIIGDINIEAAQKVADDLNQNYPDKAHPISLDVLDKKSIENCLIAHDDINTLINNAAIDPKVTKDSGPGGAFESLSEYEWDLSIDVIMKGTFLCSQVFCPFFANKGGGIVVNISSVLGVIAPNQSIYGESFKPITYSAAKHGIVGMTKYLATYYAQSNVRVNALSPGGVFDNHPDEFVGKLTNLIPMKRMADRNEYKGSIAFLCSDASSYMTGHNLIVDGGMSVW
tara:strand:- start:37 stop:750 length:714 start_codon:yes stop_codon:yes gene_type:complete